MDHFAGAGPVRAATYFADSSSSDELHVLCCAVDVAGKTVKSVLCKLVQGAQFQAEIARQLAEKKAAAKRKREVAARSRLVHCSAMTPWAGIPFMHRDTPVPQTLHPIHA